MEWDRNGGSGGGRPATTAVQGHEDAGGGGHSNNLDHLDFLHTNNNPNPAFCFQRQEQPILHLPYWRFR